MNFIKNKQLYDSDGNALLTVDNEILLSSDYIDGYIPIDELHSKMLGKIATPVFRLFLLNYDETIKEDVSEDVIVGSGSLNMNYQQGQTRSFSVDLINENGKWNPSTINGRIWSGTKFRLDYGIVLKNTVYWKQMGIFTPNDPSLNNATSSKTISLQMSDKFALLDGSISGKTDSQYIIARGTKVKDAIQAFLDMEISASNQTYGSKKVYDMKPLIFPSKYEDYVTEYRIDKSADTSIGEIIIELANMISCDVYYNENGNLTLSSNIDDLNYNNKSILWNYKDDELQYTDTKLTVNFSKLINKVIVVGANVNGAVYKATAENRNSLSQGNIYNSPIKLEYISDSNIYSTPLALDRANYELNKKSILPLSVSIKSFYNPFLKFNELVMWSNNDYGYKNRKFIIQSINMPMGSDCRMDITMTNINELPFVV